MCQITPKSAEPFISGFHAFAEVAGNLKDYQKLALKNINWTSEPVPSFSIDNAGPCIDGDLEVTPPPPKKKKYEN